MARVELHGGHRPVAGGLARAAVFGVNDAGVAGAVAGAISMAAGEWISITAQNDLIRRELALERRELVRNTAAETTELAGMYESHGMTRETARAAAEEVMRDPAEAVGVHAREEMGIDPEDLPPALRAAVVSFACFLFGALLPVIPWFAGASGTAPAVVSLSIGIVTAAVVGAVIGRLAERPIALSVLRQTGIVVVACAVTYAIGELVGVNLS
jgi:VIT1/CCC1 family predicted Fe2+/Mn2+ transporter